MEDRTLVYVGTVGQSLWRSRDGGRTFARASAGVHSECDVRALLVHPTEPRLLHLGTETGLFVSRDGGERWKSASSALDGQQLWSLARDPRRPEVLFAGVCPAAVYRSEDGGRSWERLATGMPGQCVNGAPLAPRVTCILVDPSDGALFAGVEIAGVYRSRDGGESWEGLGAGLSSQDIHGLAAVRRGGRRTLLATTNAGPNRSTDDGESWTPLPLRDAFPWSYTRACALPADPGAVWIGVGNGPPGDQGAVGVTDDLGETWRRLPLPKVANSTIWNFAFHPADPRRVYAASVSGELYLTRDGGASWVQLPREFGEVRALAWTPG